MTEIHIRGAREHNLQGVDLVLPRERLIVFTGVSGSGKTSLAFHTLHAESQRRYVEAMSVGARQYLGMARKPVFELITGLPPSIGISQRGQDRLPGRSTVGTLTELDDVLRVLWARAGVPHCPQCDRALVAMTADDILRALLSQPVGARLELLAPVQRGVKGGVQPLFAELLRAGFMRARVDGQVCTTDQPPIVDARQPHTVEVVVDRLKAGPTHTERIQEAIRTALKAGRGAMIAVIDGVDHYLGTTGRCPNCDIAVPPLTPALFSRQRPSGWCPRCAEQAEDAECVVCAGSRLNPAARAARLGGWTLPAFVALNMEETRAALARLDLPAPLAPLREDALGRLGFLIGVGLGYLSLGREAATLSGGELQRTRLAAGAGNQLSGVLYVLDEPTAGLHPHDTALLLRALRALRDLGNTVIVVEHDPLVIAAADVCVDFGPGAGQEGGRVTFIGTPDALAQSDTVTGRWLSGRATLPHPPKRPPKRWLKLRGATGHNLQNLDVDLPLGALVGVTGVSGSGKSSLIFDTLGRALTRQLNQGGPAPLPFQSLTGVEAVRRLVRVDAVRSGRRSLPVTLAGLWSSLRQLYAQTQAARERGLGPDFFSLHRPGGRCEACKGEGVLRIPLDLLPTVTATCETCGGTRYSSEARTVSLYGFDPAALLAQPIHAARSLFLRHPKLAPTFAQLDALGLGYLPLGQPGESLSGGEVQRLLLARELGRPGQVEGTLYLVDEPTVGLHPADVERLVEAFHALVHAGGTVIVVEHDPLFLSTCDATLTLGPGAGANGGRIISPEELLS